MDWKMWVIIILIAFITLNHMNKIDGDKLINQGTDQVIDWKDQLIAGGDTACPTAFDPVCGNGVTYTNQCEATRAGVTNITLGECPGTPI